MLSVTATASEILHTPRTRRNDVYVIITVQYGYSVPAASVCVCVRGTARKLLRTHNIKCVF